MNLKLQCLVLLEFEGECCLKVGPHRRVRARQNLLIAMGWSRLNLLMPRGWSRLNMLIATGWSRHLCLR